MHRKKRIAGLMAALLVSAAVAGCSAQSGSTSEKIASYDQGELSKDAFYERLVSETGLSMMLEMVDKGILDVVYPVDDEMKADVEENLAAVKEYYGDDFENALSQNGFKGEDAYKDAMYLNLQRNAYITAYVEENVLEASAVEEYYDSYTPDIEASHILIKPEGDSDADWTSAEETAQSLISRYEAGESFEELASAYSADPGSGAAGGSLGSFGKGVMVPAFEEAAFALGVGEHTKTPVKTQFGYHIILKTGGDEKPALEDMRDEIVENLVAQALQADESLGFKALKEMREENGFTIDNPTLDDQYGVMMQEIEAE